MGGFLTALTFLTTVPVGATKSPAKGDLGRAVVWFPVVGMLVGLGLAGVDWGARTAWDAHVAAALILGANLLITGGLHIDGLMDTADALFSRASRERMLEIMRDARAGALGVAAGSCVLLAKFAAYAHLAGEGHWRVITAAPVVGRMAMVVTLVVFPYARSAGVGHGFVSEAGWRHLVGAAVLCSAVCTGLFGLAGLGLVGIGLGLAAVVGLRVSTSIGGVTGDVYGAVNELVEVGVLLLGAAILARPA